MRNCTHCLKVVSKNKLVNNFGNVKYQIKFISNLKDTEKQIWLSISKRRGKGNRQNWTVKGHLLERTVMIQKWSLILCLSVLINGFLFGHGSDWSLEWFSGLFVPFFMKTWAGPAKNEKEEKKREKVGSLFPCSKWALPKWGF